MPDIIRGIRERVSKIRSNNDDYFYSESELDTNLLNRQNCKFGIIPDKSVDIAYAPTFLSEYTIVDDDFQRGKNYKRRSYPTKTISFIALAIWDNCASPR